MADTDEIGDFIADMMRLNSLSYPNGRFDLCVMRVRVSIMDMSDAEDVKTGASQIIWDMFQDAERWFDPSHVYEYWNMDLPTALSERLRSAADRRLGKLPEQPETLPKKRSFGQYIGAFRRVQNDDYAKARPRVLDTADNGASMAQQQQVQEALTKAGEKARHMKSEARLRHNVFEDIKMQRDPNRQFQEVDYIKQAEYSKRLRDSQVERHAEAAENLRERRNARRTALFENNEMLTAIARVRAYTR